MSVQIMSDLTERAANQFGDAVAVTMSDGVCASFAGINSCAARFAGGLCSVGISPGDRVVLYLPNSIEWIIAYHGAARLGAVIVPANYLLTPEEVAFISQHADARLIVTMPEKARPLREAIELDCSPLIVVAGPGNDGAPSLEGLLSAAPLEPRASAPDDLFMIAYTSGTTGNPKGAMITQRAAFFSTVMTATIHVRHQEDRVFTALPFPHVYGNVVMNAAFIAGYQLFVQPRFDAREAMKIIQECEITLVEGVPTMYYQMMALGDRQTDFRSLKRCTVGGQTMPVASVKEVEARFGCPVLELWGMTELAGPATTHSPYWPSRHGSIGVPFQGMEAKIVGLQAPCADVEPGEAGELHVRGPQVMKGFWKNSEATSAAIDKEGWFATGDVAYADAEGYLFIVDRRKDIIITAGYNVYPAEIEQVIAEHPAVAMVAVGAVPDTEKGELAKAFVVLRPGASCTEQELLALCKQRLAAYKAPRLLAFVEDLPKTSTGKIMRRALT